MYQQPSILIPDSEKNEQYHKDWAMSIISGSLTESWANQYNLMAELYKFAQSGSSGELTKFLQETEIGTTLPAYWITTNTIKTKIDLLMGDLEERGEEITARAINKEAVYRKLEEKERLRIQRKIRNNPSVVEAQEISGIPLFKDEYIPQSDTELDEYIDLSFKDKAELIMTGALRWTCATEMWEDHRVKGFGDVLMAGPVIHKICMERGKPRAERVDPLCFVIDPRVKDDMCSDATFFAEVYEMPVANVAEQYSLSLKELKEVEGEYNAFLSGALTTPSANGFDSIPNNRWKWFKNVDNTTRVLVVKAVWRDFIEIKHKDEINPNYGSEHIQATDSDEVRNPKTDKIIKNKLQVWRQATVIGGKIVKEWGLMPNQPRELPTLEKTEPPYHVWIPNLYLGKTVSKTEQLVGLQLLKDIMMYNLQVEISTSPGRILQYDLAMMPTGMTKEHVQSYIKSEKIAYINSKEYQLTGGSDMIKGIDLSLTQAITPILTTMQYLDGEMDRISGVSPERQGIVQGASQAVGVTNSALFQSNLITAPLYRGYYRHCSRVLNHLAKMIKITWPENYEMYAPIIGDVGIDFLKEHQDIDLDSFSIVVQSLPPILRDRAKLEEIVTFMVQADPSLAADAITLLMEPDVKQAVRRLQRKTLFRKYLEAKQLQMQQEQDAQLQQQLQQAEMNDREATRQARIQETQMKAQNNTERAVISAKQKLLEKKLDLRMPK